MDGRHARAGSPGLAEAAQVAHGQRSRLVRRAALAVVGLSTLAFVAPAAATTETFEFTGTAQTWTVPAGVTSATFDLYGAQGENFAESGIPGLGGRATATIAVTPGASIQINVGGQGAAFGAAGFNGGGGGVDNAGGGGGGASDIRVGGNELDDRVLVAGGGGGTGNCIDFGQGTDGGDGGGENGEDATGPAEGCGAAGEGGTQTDGGSATAPATDGAFGFGGDAATDNGVAAAAAAAAGGAAAAV